MTRIRNIRIAFFVVFVCLLMGFLVIGQAFLSNKNISVVVNDTNFLYELRDNKERRKDNEKFKHKQEKPSGFETLCHQDPSCPVKCNVCCLLPYHTKTGILMAHHSDAENSIWNQDERFENLKISEDKNLIVYVGANTHGRDGYKLMTRCPKCNIHIFEPVPQFYDELKNFWASYKNSFGWDSQTYNYGLGSTDRVVKISKAEILGESTFGMKGNEGDQNDLVELQVRSATKVLESLLSDSGSSFVDLLHVNCEGCEWEMLENLIDSGMYRRIRSIQFGSHYFPQVEGITSRFCAIRERLGLTHQMEYGVPWAWERWNLMN